MHSYIKISKMCVLYMSEFVWSSNSLPRNTVFNPGGLLCIQMPSYRYRNSHYENKRISRPSHLYNGNSISGEGGGGMSLYWNGARLTWFIPTFQWRVDVSCLLVPTTYRMFIMRFERSRVTIVNYLQCTKRALHMARVFFVLLRFGVCGLLSYPREILHWHWDNHTIAPLMVMLTSSIWVYQSCRPTRK